ncbi:hypothetical protein KZX06_08595 [Micrococcus sp. EYE_162]|uniref:hypothetical protein n=1 Tax=unclassified Micrococcus TaxID=2620948 RepID=UPI002004C73F|nr:MULTISPECIES: hypothetical protein [unclassified Micrococcus]MCK6095995.1 hypothetical protein [Micrococcus sp. EYE_212]MCK6172086.1 hypothetical protein [Micrococcus sp. EYE_162]
MENNSSSRVTAPEAAQALAQAEDVHRRAAYAGVEPWWVDALAAVGMATMAVGLISRTLWGALLGAALFVIGSFVFTSRQRRRGMLRDRQVTVSTALMFGGVYGVTFAAGQLLPEQRDPVALTVGALVLALVGFVFLRWSSHRAARRLVETQGRTRTLS